MGVEEWTTGVKLTLWDGEAFFGPGVCELLEGIREKGSIQAAAAGMKMSYTKAWRILNRVESAMGTQLVTRVSGGRHGGSSRLTEVGERAVRAYRDMELALSRTADALLNAHREMFEARGERDDLPR